MKSIIPHYYHSTEKSERLALILRKEQTFSEARFWKIARGRKLLNLKIRRQHPIGPFIVDFYCDELKLVIEIDGDVHLLPEVKERDYSRQNYLIEKGLTVIRFTNEEVLFNPDIIEEKIKSFVDQSF